MPKNFIATRNIENTIPKARKLFQYKACLIITSQIHSISLVKI